MFGLRFSLRKIIIKKFQGVVLQSHWPIESLVNPNQKDEN